MVAAKLISVADLHGDFKRAVDILVLAKLIDQESHSWIGGDSVLVQTGDIVDRGSHAKQIYQMFFDLRDQARKVGGQVINLLGNHEVMNLQHDWRYVAEADIEEFGGKEERAKAWSSSGWLGSQVMKFPVAVVIEGVLFVHAGVLPDIILNRSLEDLNHDVRMVLAGDMTEPSKDRRELLGPRGPVWARDYASGSVAACAKAADVLSRLGASRMVVGHTIQRDFRIHARCEGKIILADTAISQSYGGKVSFLEHGAGGATAVYPGTGERVPLGHSAVEPQPDKNLNVVPSGEQSLPSSVMSATRWRPDLAALGVLVTAATLAAWWCRFREKPRRHAT